MDDSEIFIHEFTKSAYARTLESELGLPEDWITFIAAEDDWSFVIKCHALLESAANRALTETLGRPNLLKFISRLELSGERTGKVSLLVNLGHLDSDCKRFISKLSELRNALVHEVANTNLTINEYLEHLSETDRKGFVKAFRWGITDWKTFNCAKLDQDDEAKSLFYISAASSWQESQIFAIWLGVLFVLRRLHLAFQKERMVQQEIVELRELAQSVKNSLRSAQ